jgi:hypothetical protein
MTWGKVDRRGGRHMTARVPGERDVLVVACAVSAGIHAALTPSHVDEGVGPGLGFLVATVLLAGLAVALTRAAGRVGLSLSVLVLGGLLATYVLAVTSGAPLLHPEREPVEVLAVLTKVVEAAGLVAALHLLTRGRAAAAIHLPPKGTTT